MKKIVAFALFCVLFFAVSCDSGSKFETPNDRNSDAYQDDSEYPSAAECESNMDCPIGYICDTTKKICTKGDRERDIYLGIIGFNDDLTIMPIKRLTDANKQEFKSFISDLQQLNYTALYWADYSALEMMRDYNPVPEKLKKVAMVTFTDGLDNQSLASDDFNPGFNSQAEYANAIHSMIMDEKGIHGLPVTAYSIGLTGKDVFDVDKFTETLEKLATEESGDEKFVFQVSDMNEVGQHFAEIASSLYKVSTTINVGVYIPGGYDNGQVIRYTFDNVTAAADSALYIEAKYRRSGTSRKLENIKYKGFITGASTISSSATGPHNELYFQFNDLKYSNGDPVSQSEIISKSRLWKQTSSGAWDGETEMNMAELSPVIDEDKSSALIMLVLDATTSLGSDFSSMQTEARNFVEILVNGGSGVTSSTSCDPNPCESDSNSNGVCTVSGSSYTCGCKSGYTWNGSYCQSNDDSTLPECSSSTTSFPCKDPSTSYIWSAKNTDGKTWQQAKDHCAGLNTSNYGGFSSGWHLPTISELRTLIKNCSAMQMPPVGSDTCGVREDESVTCLASSCRGENCSCSSDSSGGNSKFRDTGWFWSSSLLSDDSNGAWYVAFGNGYVGHYDIDSSSYVRCVR